MLSKSAARLFFIAGTAAFSLVFLALTVDTMRQVPERSNAKDLTDSVRRGHDLWTFNNCMGCHTLLGEGALLCTGTHQGHRAPGQALDSRLYQRPPGHVPGPPQDD